MNSLADEVILLKERRSGTGPAKAARREGDLPGVIYGKGIESLAVSLDSKEARKLLARPRGHIHRFQVEDTDVTGNVMVQEVEYDIIKRHPIHIDLRSVSMTDLIRVDVAVILTGEEALIKQGLILQRQLRDVSLECLPGDIPSSIVMDAAHLSPGDTITVADLDIPGDVKILTSPQEVLAVASVPRVAETVDVEEEEEEEISEEEVQEEDTPSEEEED